MEIKKISGYRKIGVGWIHAALPLKWSSEYKLSLRQCLKWMFKALVDKNYILGIYSSDCLVGYIWAQPVSPDSYKIVSLYVRSRYRNLGYACALKNELEKRLQAHQVVKLVSRVNISNHGMISLNKKLQYQVAKTNDDWIYFEKFLGVVKSQI